MAALRHQVWMSAPISTVYEALASAEGLGNWWAPHTATRTDAGLVLSHDPGEQHGRVDMRVIESSPPRRVEWEIISRHPRRSPASAWTGTRISFELSERDNPGAWMGMDPGRPRLTVLDFSHSGWDENSEFYGFCNFAWGETLMRLKHWCEAA